MDTILAVIVIAIALIIATGIKNRPTKLKEPVMERGRDKGKLVVGKTEYESSDVTVVAQQETVRENEPKRQTLNRTPQLILPVYCQLIIALFIYTCIYQQDT